MLSLKEMFGEQGHSARQETMRQIYNTKARGFASGGVPVNWTTGIYVSPRERVSHPSAICN